MGRTRRRFLGLAGSAATLGATAGCLSSRAGQQGYATVRVPQDRETVQAGVDAARAGDLVLVDSGTYPEAVLVETPGIVVRGVDRNDVVLDGEFERGIGVKIQADGVAVENLTARHYRADAFYWTHVEGFRGSYLTAYNNGDYGLYAYDSLDGRFEYGYASGHPDAGIYLGRRNPFDALVTDCTVEYNAWGFSGTSAGGDLVVRDSTFRNNQAGIVPNTLLEGDPPQHDATVVGNEVVANNYRDAPTKYYAYPALGTGIALWGASENIVRDNDVRDHEHVGIGAFPNVVVPEDNVVEGNRVSGSGLADLGVASPASGTNEFRDNEYGTALPENVEDGLQPDGGSERLRTVYDELRATAESDGFEGGDWREQPVPADRPSMPDPEAAPQPANRETSVGPG